MIIADFLDRIEKKYCYTNQIYFLKLFPGK